MSLRTPSYRLHKPTGQAVVTIDGRDFYLGKHGSAASHGEYDRLIAEWLSNGRRLVASSDLSIAEVMAPYIRHVDAYYVKDGRSTSEARLIKDALKVLKQLYGHTPAKDFGPKSLKTVRQAYLDADLSRGEVNRRTGLVKRFIGWAVENELVPGSVHHALRAVPGLRKGRTEARETVPVKPVPDAIVDAIEPHVAPRIWAMVQLQRLTGMRPGEVCIMRSCDLDTSGEVWVYTPGSHKTQHHGRTRRIYLGPAAQQTLRSWLKDDPAAFIFSPKDFTAELMAAKRQARKTRIQPSQRDRRKARPRKTPGDRYTPNSYRHAIAVGCDKASVPRFFPNQLRHSVATRLRRDHGLDVARVVLGHSSPVVTQHYAELDENKAIAVMRDAG